MFKATLKSNLFTSTLRMHTHFDKQKLLIKVTIYRIRRIIGGVFNLAVWRIIFNPPNLNNAITGL